MASNYFPVGLLDQPWGEDDSLGTLSSLERRQRKAAEKSDINAFYKFLGIVFVTLTLLLLGSELYTVATEPSRGLTGAFFLEIGRMSGVAYGQLQNLYKAVGDVAWTGIAVVYGHDFAQRGVSITDGAAQLLANGLYYLALALSVLIMYYAHPAVVCAPLRTAALSTLTAGGLFGAPTLYAWLVSRLCKTRSPEPVVLWALLFAGMMCFASLSVVRTVGIRPGDAPHHAPGVASLSRHRSSAALRCQRPMTASAASAMGSGGAAGNAASTGSSGHRRSAQSRTTSVGRNGGGSGSGSIAAAAAMARGDAMQPPSMARSGSSASLTVSGGLLAAFSCLSGASTPGSTADPVGMQASVRAVHRTTGSSGVSGSRSTADLTPAPHASGGVPPNPTSSMVTKRGAAAAAAAAAQRGTTGGGAAATGPFSSSSSSSFAPSASAAAAVDGRDRPTGHAYGLPACFDPVGVSSSKLAGSSAPPRSSGTRRAMSAVLGGTAAAVAGFGSGSSSNSSCSASAAAKLNTSNSSSSSKVRQQTGSPACGSTGGGGGGPDRPSKAKQGAGGSGGSNGGAAPGSPSPSQTRSSTAADPAAVHTNGSSRQADTGSHASKTKHSHQHDPAAAPLVAHRESVAAAAGTTSLSSSSATLALSSLSTTTTTAGPMAPLVAASKRKGSSNAPGSSASSSSGSAATATAAAVPGPAASLLCPAVTPRAVAAIGTSCQQQQSAPSIGASAVVPIAPLAAAAAASTGTSSRSCRPEVAGSKPATGTTGTTSFLSLSTAKGTSSPASNATTITTNAGGLLSRLTASVASAAAAAPAMAGRTAKKAVATTAAFSRKPHGPQQQSPLPPPSSPQYVIVQPPPPPPPRKSHVQIADSSVAAPAAAATATPASGAQPAGGGGAAAAATAAVTSSQSSVSRNPWLNPNPAIKLAVGLPKGLKSAPAAGRQSQSMPMSVHHPAAAAAAAAAEAPAGAARSSGGGGAAAMHSLVASSARSISYGGSAAATASATAGVTSAYPSIVDSDSHAYARPPIFGNTAAATATTAAPHLSSEPVATAAVAAVAAAPVLGVPASVFLQPHTQEQLRNHFQSNSATTGPDSFISTTFISSDASVGPLVAHKHASGDLDIANVAANYHPYPSAVTTPRNEFSTVPILRAAESESTDSFSLFSTPPPPLITSEAAAAAAASIDPAVGLMPADAEPAPRGVSTGAAGHVLYGSYGMYGGHYTALPSLGGDPVWSHNVPSVFGVPPGLKGARAAATAAMAPPPGFPSHAYGGVFAAGPVSGGGDGWEQSAAAAAAVVATTASSTLSAALPLPPAGKNDVLASLGFVDDGADAAADGASGGGGGSSEDAGASCAICWSEPRQVGFLHGKTSHLCVCRRCAAKLREGVHRCPMCRQLIERIIDIY